MKKETKNIISNWIIPAAIGIAIALIINTFFAGLVRVNGNSMNPTFKDGQMLIMQRAFVKYNQGDIVVADIIRFDNNKKETIIKRIIATEGQTVEIKDGQVIVDGEILEEDYIKEEMLKGQDFEQITVPAGEVYVLGDNRNNSLDSRIQGTIKVEKLKGKIIFQ